jgi:hypothetical protein
MPLAFERMPQHCPEGIFVFDDQYLCGSGHVTVSLAPFEARRLSRAEGAEWSGRVSADNALRA